MLGIASDHAGFELKEDLKRFLKELELPFQDYGPPDDRSVDYPDYAQDVARGIAEGRLDGGILVCGTGIGMAIVANKHPGVRAALVTSVYAARMAKMHTDANVLCLSGWFTGKGMAREMVRAWTESQFEGGRHQRRVDKIRAVEEQLRRT